MSVENDKAIMYKILEALEEGMDDHPFDTSKIDYKQYGITEERWKSIMQMLIEDKYIEGAKATEYLGGSLQIDMMSTRITSKGLEYLNRNGMQKKNAKSENIERGSLIGEEIYTSFDTYRVIRVIGQGGNGIVYEAVNSNEEHFAIKVVDIKNLSTEKRKRFKNEINFCQRRENEHIVSVIDTGGNGQSSFYVMPLYNETLRDRMKNGISPSDAIEIFDSLLDGLEYAHSEGIYHRDIKPENILLNHNSNESILADFGIAHFPKEHQLTTVETKVNAKMANFQYAAPEQRVKGGQVDGRADVFAAGLILNEMLTGELIGGGDYKKIGETYQEYSFLDRVVDELYKQNPDDRLYPITKIRAELQARIEMSKLDLKETHLIDKICKKDSEGDTSYEFSMPNLISISIKDDVLLFKFEGRLPNKWFKVLTEGIYDHKEVMHYGPEKFKLSNENTIILNIDGAKSKETIGEIVEYFKQWLPIVTKVYNVELKEEREHERQEKLDKIKKEIEYMEKNKELNTYVETLV